MKNKLIYLTYQSFPADTANSLQSISTIKYFVKNKMEVELYFPLRNKESNSDIEKLQKYYSFDERFKATGLKHIYPFGKTKFFNKISFHLSHFLWSKKYSNQIYQKNKDCYFFTRSEIIAYYLAKKGASVVFECHQRSKVRDFVMNRLKKYKNIKFIFLNENLSNFYNVKQNSIILHNGVDSELFTEKKIKKDKSLVFVGSLSRFNSSRGIEFVVDCFNNSKLSDYTFDIIGGNSSEVERLRKYINKLDLGERIKAHGRLNRNSIVKFLEICEIGLLTNSKNNNHSYLYTSPLKYFEYLYADLNIIAPEFPAHKSLPFSEYINFYNYENEENFIEVLLGVKYKINLSQSDLNTITLNSRVKNIINFILN
tara:strand:+ start:234 stop:1340 length:1107 start_codon:yes stop_codon:yes gene_type:complete